MLLGQLVLNYVEKDPEIGQPEVAFKFEDGEGVLLAIEIIFHNGITLQK